MKLNILIVEDHEMMIQGYKSILSIHKDQYDVTITAAHNCETAYDIITNPENKTIFDLLFLDYSIPAFPEKKIYSGLELGALIRHNMPSTKIIMLTSFSDSIRLFEVVKKFQPNGLLIKSDYKPDTLLVAIKTVIEGATYYSPQAIESIKQPLFTKGSLDSIDREIIVLIAEGFQISSIAKKLNASDDTIKKRKSKIKDLLGILKGNDEDIVRECRALGLL
jgi:DNA-binding NarL/FixJ family response regulator